MMVRFKLHTVLPHPHELLKSFFHEINQRDRCVYCSDVQMTGPEPASPQLTSTSNQAPSSLVVGLCSAAGALTSLSLLFCLARRICFSARDRSGIHAKSGTCLDNFVTCSLELSSGVLDNESAESDKNCNLTCPNQTSEADYSKEFEDVLKSI